MTATTAKACKDMTFEEVRLFLRSVYGINDYHDKFLQFKTFMVGQTGGMNSNGEIVCFKYDINRFLAGLPVID